MAALAWLGSRSLAQIPLPAMAGGIPAAVAVDMACARAVHRAGMKVGHLGHLQQVAKFEAAAAAAFETALGRCFAEIARVLRPEGRLVFTYQHRLAAAWAALAGALAGGIGAASLPC